MTFRFPWFTCALTLAAATASFMPGAAGTLEYTRSAVENGEVWRWFTAHFVHFGASHFAWDALALAALGATCEFHSRRSMFIAVALAGVAITPALWLWQPEFATYRGLSGIDSALYGLLGVRIAQRRAPLDRLLGWAALAGFGLKCGVEMFTQAAVFARSEDYVPVPLAHLVGLAAGLMAGTVLRKRHRSVVESRGLGRN